MKEIRTSQGQRGITAKSEGEGGRGEKMHYQLPQVWFAWPGKQKVERRGHLALIEQSLLVFTATFLASFTFSFFSLLNATKLKLLTKAIFTPFFLRFLLKKSQCRVHLFIFLSLHSFSSLPFNLELEG